MNCKTLFAPNSFPLGLNALVLFALILKAIFVVQQIGSPVPGPLTIQLLINDFPVLAFTLFLSALSASLRSSFFRVLFFGLAVCCFGLYVADCILITSVNLRLNPSDVLKYFRHVVILFPLITVPHLIGVVLGIPLVLYFSKPISLRGRCFLFALSFLLFGFSTWTRQYSHSLVRPYSWNNFRFSPPRPGPLDPGHFYSEEELSRYLSIHDDSRRADPKLPDRLLLLIVESLSASDSLRASGLENNLPHFDALSQEGSFFPNGIANYPDSEGGLIALLGGVIPIPFEGSGNNLYLSFRSRQSPVNDLNARGYRTIFATNALLSWIYKSAYLSSLGFASVFGPENTPELGEKPRFTCDAPADEHLYNYALQKVLPVLLNEHDKFFLTLATVSLHRPYLDPLGKENSRAAVLRYVDTELIRFVSELRKLDFFSSGTLIVVGDHRRMEPLTLDEDSYYGESAIARIPLLIIGPGASPGRLDTRLFQQADLLRKYSAFLEPTAGDISANPIFVDRYSRLQQYLPGEPGKISVYAREKSGAPLRLQVFSGGVFGNQINWLQRPEHLAKDIEPQIHRHRAYFQSEFYSLSFPSRCGPIANFETWRQQESKGLSGESISTSTLNRRQAKLKIDQEPAYTFSLEGRSSDQAGEVEQTTLRGYLILPSPGEFILEISTNTAFCIFSQADTPFDKNELPPFRNTFKIPIDAKSETEPIEFRFWHTAEQEIRFHLELHEKGKIGPRTLTQAEFYAVQTIG